MSSRETTCKYCTGICESMRIYDHNRVCPKHPDNHYIVVAITTTGEPVTMPPPVLYGGPVLIGNGYYPPEQIDKYDSSRITALAYMVYRGGVLESSFTSETFDSTTNQLDESEIADAMKELFKVASGCSLMVTHNHAHDYNIIASEVHRMGLSVILKPIDDVWQYETMQMGLHSGLLIAIRRSLSDLHWKLFDQHIDETDVKAKVTALADCYIYHAAEDPVKSRLNASTHVPTASQFDEHDDLLLLTDSD